MQVHVEEARGIRRATASIRDSGIVWVKVPRHWNKVVKHEVIQHLVGQIERKDAREKALLAKQGAKQERITIRTREELEAYVRRINTETFNVPLGQIRMGYARYNHLAQVNLRTKTMTVSKYCLNNAPTEALRYLIVHELAHYFVAGHNAKFWALVGQHVPDYRLQSRIIKAFHHQAVIAEGLTDLPEQEAHKQNNGQPDDRLQTPVTNETEILPATHGHLNPPPKPRRATRPKASRPIKKTLPAASPSLDHQAHQKPADLPDHLRQGLGWFRQLLLWGER